MCIFNYLQRADNLLLGLLSSATSLIATAYIGFFYTSPFLCSRFTIFATQDLQEAEKDKNSADDKAWRKSFVRACNHAAMKQVQNDKKTDNDSDEEGEDGVSLGSR